MTTIAFLGNFSTPHSSESHHAKTLENMGFSVTRLQENHTSPGQIAAQAAGADLFVWIHTHGWSTAGMDTVLATLRRARIPSITYHLDLWMGLRRQSDIASSPYWNIDHFWTVDQRMADWLNKHTPVQGHFIPAGVFADECYISDQRSPHANDVIFVGSRRYHPEWPWRPQLIDWLAATYGPRFTHVGMDGVASVRGEALNALYSSSKVAVGDSLCAGFDYPFYTSDRLFEAPGRGAFQVFPDIVGVRDWFPPDTLKLFKFNDFSGLKRLIDHYLVFDEEREALRLAGHEHVKAHHTYTHRWRTILTELGFAC